MSGFDAQALMDISDIPGFNTDETPVYEPLVLSEVVSNPNDRKPDLEDDYIIVRRNMHHQAEMLMDAAKVMLETSKNSDSPRHMEVFATLMGQVTSTNKEMLKVHKEMKEITNETTNTKSGATNNIETAIFMGSPSDMLEEFGDTYDVRAEQAAREHIGSSSGDDAS
ncbi:terminase small subunit [Serratia phage 92A1]|nr:terminase small subunit [Serratia phage 92A1]